MDASFTAEMAAGYRLDEPGIVIGSPLLGGEVETGVRVQVALSMLNRHGLVAGATGTGKTKTLQVLAGQASDAGIPCFIADVKGDLTGMAEPGDPTNPKVQQRCAELGWAMTPAGHTVELLSLTGKLGVPVRASVHSFGPLLLSKVLDLNETQTAVLSLVFAYCDDQSLPLLDLDDLRTTVAYLASDEGKDALAAYGGIAPATASVHPAGDRHPRAAGRRRPVRLARVRGLRPPAHDARRARHRLAARALRRHGPPAPVQHVHALAARPAVHHAARGGRPPEAEALLLLRRGPPALRRRVGRAARADRAHRPAHPVEGCRRLLRDPGADRRAVVGPGPAWQPRPARPSRLHARRTRRTWRRR